jgi:hypothetical protein
MWLGKCGQSVNINFTGATARVNLHVYCEKLFKA